jgi:hypothetical protein
MAKLVFLALLALGSVHALITLKDINQLTNITTDCFENITRKGSIAYLSSADQKLFRVRDGEDGLKDVRVK